MSLFIPILLAAVFLFGCGEVKKIAQMHDSTANMEKTTRKMSNTTSQMKDRTESLEAKAAELKKMTDELYSALRQGDALNSRRNAFESVLKAPSTYKKISEAGKYFMSFEVQLWTGTGQDKGPKQRDILAQQAAQEFFMEIEALSPRDGSVDPTQEGDAEDQYSESNRAASFNAFAVAMHLTNRKQEENLSENKDLKKISMYSILEDALISAKHHRPISSASQEVLLHEERAVQLLQARFNTFQVIFVDLMSEISKKSYPEKIRMFLFGWQANISSLSLTKAKYLADDVLIHALEAQVLLEKTGRTAILHPSLRRLLQKMELDQKNPSQSLMTESHKRLLQIAGKIQKQAFHQ